MKFQIKFTVEVDADDREHLLQACQAEDAGTVRVFLNADCAQYIEDYLLGLNVQSARVRFPGEKEER